MSLSHLETAALRLAIARGDASVARSLETFRSTMDESHLVNDLREIARATVAHTLEEKGLEIVDPDGDDEVGEGEVEEEVEEEEEPYPESDAAPASKAYEDDFEEEDDDDEGFTEEKVASPASRNSEDGGMLADQAARDHVFPILVNELIKEEIMGNEDGKTLLNLYNNGSPVVNGALDVYDLDSDMSELVDTLQKVVRSAEAAAT